MKFEKQSKWPHRLDNRSEICVEPLKKSFTLKSFIPWPGYFLKRFIKPSLYFYTSKLNKIYFSVFPSDISTPNDFRLVVDYIELPNLPKEAITVGTVNKIEFEDNYSNLVAEKPIQFHFPTPGLVFIHYRIIDNEGKKPLDKNGQEIFLAQRTLSGEIGRGYHTEHYCNVGQMPIIVLDYQSKILIKLNWFLIALTVLLTALTIILVRKGG